MKRKIIVIIIGILLISCKTQKTESVNYDVGPMVSIFGERYFNRSSYPHTVDEPFTIIKVDVFTQDSDKLKDTKTVNSNFLPEGTELIKKEINGEISYYYPPTFPETSPLVGQGILYKLEPEE